jgi:acyl-[acyl-carrier-protein]-phospholipid O-acyltransferase/long-chain-fatty-acid--[acyl-carrier-protein] ligase
LFATLFGFGILAALFGPIKYGILPDHLRRDQLPAGNALIEGATFVAILLGTMTAGLAARFGANHFYFAALLVGVAFACWISALFIPPSGVGSPSLRVDANIFASTVATIRYLRRDTRLWWGAMVTSWFWLIGIVVLSLVPPMIKTALGGNEDTVTIYLAIFSIAVGAGSGLAAAIARGRIILGTTLVGAMLIGVFSLDIGIMTFTLQSAEVVQGAAALKSVTGLRMAVDLCGLAMGGGLFIVPAFAAVQSWSEPAYRARTIAAVNVLNAAFMTAATVAVATMQKFGATIPGLFLTIGVATLLVAFAILKTMPKNKT